MTDHPASPLLPNLGPIGPLLELEQLDEDLFRNRVNDININGALFGGQVLSQALNAAVKSVAGRPPHSLHGYFIRSGDGARPVIYRVERTRDGGSFSTRRVTALQHGQPIFHMESSFHAGDPGFEHQLAPEVRAPDPDSLLTLSELAVRHAAHISPNLARRLAAFQTLEIKPTDPERQLFRRSETARNAFWMRIPTAAGLGPEEQACALAYASDSWLGAATRMVHAPAGDFTGFQMASLDHAMWFHGPIRADSWNLYETDSPWTGSGRGLARGMIFDRDGRLVASTAQEVLLRRLRE
jgi:acyl-CoA thioesterase-2